MVDIQERVDGVVSHDGMGYGDAGCGDAGDFAVLVDHGVAGEDGTWTAVPPGRAQARTSWQARMGTPLRKGDRLTDIISPAACF
ncbi:hypothetical protein Ppa06_02510 [Planomonospora parontospora subsp. parontospora]|uniref:Uncharacterized protein n=2 Tax=Planomonospora parontospora TaxID=58119 RepID=A0AA37BBH5_9ACTN|nr:hypothetical protein GCM10010126_02520 [Planomonospora parontospora]GII06453.1 hypothetical protein Ppa06_02510 [Planomonospora parontospora subsp. parontospora]